MAHRRPRGLILLGHRFDGTEVICMTSIPSRKRRGPMVGRGDGAGRELQIGRASARLITESC